VATVLEKNMLIQLVAQHPEAIPTVLRSTPTWVWGLLGGLLVLGATQLRDRTASLARVSLLPITMTAFSVWGTFSALGRSHLFLPAVAVWMAAAALAFVLLAGGRARAEYDPVQRSYRLPGSVVPLLLIAGIFLVKYVVGVDLAMAPNLVQDPQYALTVAGLYGAFTGLFVGRTARLWRLALGRGGVAAA
jgi:hypothetical protein